LFRSLWVLHGLLQIEERGPNGDFAIPLGVAGAVKLAIPNAPMGARISCGPSFVPKESGIWIMQTSLLEPKAAES
jgi:hypothetical protein